MNSSIVNAAREFQSDIILKATALDDRISTILGKAAALNLKGKPTRYRIGNLKKYAGILSNRYSGNLDELIKKLENFERDVLNIVKHGRIVDGLGEIAFSKDEETYRFDEKTIATIRKEYWEFMNGLQEISYNLEYGKTI